MLPLIALKKIKTNKQLKRKKKWMKATEREHKAYNSLSLKQNFKRLINGRER